MTTIVTSGDLHVTPARVGPFLGTAVHDVALRNATVALDTAPREIRTIAVSPR